MQAWDDVSASGNNATGANSPVALLPDPVTGLSCLTFKPSQSSGDLLTATVATSSGATAFVLCYCEPYQAAAGLTMLFLRNTDGQKLLTVFDPGGVKFRVRTDLAADTQSSAGADLRGSWARLILTYDGTTARLWVNGASVGTLTPAGGGNCTCNSFTIPSTSGVAGCKLGAAGVYSRALTGSEIASLDSWMATKVTAADPEPASATAVSPFGLSDCEYGFDSTASAVLRNGASEATATGSVTAWQPTVGSLTLSQPGGLDAPTRETVSSTSVVRFQPTGTPSLGSNLGASRSLSAYTVHLVYKLNTFAQTVAAVAIGATRGQPALQVQGGPAGSECQHVLFTGMTGGSGGSVGQNPVVDSHWHVLTVSYNTRRARAWVDGIELVNGVNNTVPPSALQTLASSFTQGGFWLGYQGAGLACGLDIAAVSFHLGEHSFRQHRQTLAWARSTYASLFAGWDTAPVVAWIGASNLLTGSGATDHLAARLCLAATAKYTRAYLLATGSLTSPLLRQRVERQLKYLFAGRSGRKVVAIYVGGNDFTASFSDANIALYKGYLRTAALAAGADVVVEGTQLPRTGADDTARATYNTALRAAASATVVVADLAADTTIGENGDNANATYYSDGIHLTDAGQEVAAGVWGPAIDGAIP